MGSFCWWIIDTLSHHTWYRMSPIGGKGKSISELMSVLIEMNQFPFQSERGSNGESVSLKDGAILVYQHQYLLLAG